MAPNLGQWLTRDMCNCTGDWDVVLPSYELLPRANAARQADALVPLAGTTTWAFVRVDVVDGRSPDRSRGSSGDRSCRFALFPLPLAGSDVLQLVPPFLWSTAISVVPRIIASNP